MKLLNLTFLLVSQALLANITLGAAIPKDIILRELDNHETGPVLASSEKDESITQLVARGRFSFGSGSSTTTLTGPAPATGYMPSTNTRTQVATKLRGGLTSARQKLSNARQSAGTWFKQASSRVGGIAPTDNLNLNQQPSTQTQAGRNSAVQPLNEYDGWLGTKLGASPQSLAAGPATLGNPGMQATNSGGGRF